MMQGLSVIIGLFRFAGYNPDQLRVDSFKGCLSNILKQDGVFEIIVAEVLFDGQRPITEYLSVEATCRIKYISFRKPDQYRYVFHKETLWNLASIEAKYDVLLFLDGDVGHSDPTWFQRIQDYHRSNPEFVCQPWEYTQDTKDSRSNMKSYLSACLGKMSVKQQLSPGICWSMHQQLWKKFGEFNTWGITGAGDSIFFQEHCYHDPRFYQMADLSWCAEIFRYQKHDYFSYFPDTVIHFYHGIPRDYYNHLAIIKQYLLATSTHLKDAFGIDQQGFVFFKNQVLRDKLISNFDWQRVVPETHSKLVDFSSLPDLEEPIVKYYSTNLRKNFDNSAIVDRGIYLDRLSHREQYYFELPVRGDYGLVDLSDPAITLEVEIEGEGCSMSLSDANGQQTKIIPLYRGMSQFKISDLEGTSNRINRTKVKAFRFRGSQTCRIQKLHFTNKQPPIAILVPLITPSEEDLSALTTQILHLNKQNISFEYVLLELNTRPRAEHLRKYFTDAKLTYCFFNYETKHIGLNHVGNLIKLGLDKTRNERILVLDPYAYPGNPSWLSSIVYALNQESYNLLQPYSTLWNNKGERTIGKVEAMLQKVETEDRGIAWAFKRNNFCLQPCYLGDDFLYTLEQYSRNTLGMHGVDLEGGYFENQVKTKGQMKFGCLKQALLCNKKAKSSLHKIHRKFQENGSILEEDVVENNGLFCWQRDGERRAIVVGLQLFNIQG